MVKARAAEETEYDEILAMTQEAFRKSSNEDSTGELERDIVEATLKNDPNFHKGDLRIAEAKGQIVSMMLIIRRQARIGKAIINNAIVSPVATRSGYEKKGYCNTVMQDAIGYMKKEEFDITTLWGHPWLYPHYGYSPAMVAPAVAIKPERCKPVEVKRKFTIKPFDTTQTEEVTGIYHNNTMNQVLATLRYPQSFEWKIRSPHVVFQTLIDKRGRVKGYYSISEKPPEKKVLEVGVANDEACKAIFNTLLDYAREKNLIELICPMSPKHPFARFAYWQNAEIRTTMGSGAGMAQILNIETFLNKMKKELQSRLDSSEFHSKTVSLAIRTESGSLILSISNGKIAISDCTEKADYSMEASLSSLTPLATGYVKAYELLDRNEIRLSKKDTCTLLRLVDVLFPENTPYDCHLPLVWE